MHIEIFSENFKPVLQICIAVAKAADGLFTSVICVKEVNIFNYPILQKIIFLVEVKLNISCEYPCK